MTVNDLIQILQSKSQDAVVKIAVWDRRMQCYFWEELDYSGDFDNEYQVVLE